MTILLKEEKEENGQAIVPAQEKKTKLDFINVRHLHYLLQSLFERTLDI